MSDKTTKQTKAQLFEMLAEAVRNTQPPISAMQADPSHDARPKPKRTTKTKTTEASGRKKRSR